MRLKAAFAALGLCVCSALSASDGLQPGDFGYRHHELHRYYQQITSKEVQPGDPGYRHEELRKQYEKVFNTGKCHCATGECRQTTWRKSAGSPTGFEVIINRVWCKVPKEAWLTNIDVPPELRVDPAHVCAGSTIGSDGCPTTIECVRINDDS